jgi:hypothetical protein
MTWCLGRSQLILSRRFRWTNEDHLPVRWYDTLTNFNTGHLQRKPDVWFSFIVFHLPIRQVWFTIENLVASTGPSETQTCSYLPSYVKFHLSNDAHWWLYPRLFSINGDLTHYWCWSNSYHSHMVSPHSRQLLEIWWLRYQEVGLPQLIGGDWNHGNLDWLSHTFPSYWATNQPHVEAHFRWFLPVWLDPQ